MGVAMAAARVEQDTIAALPGSRLSSSSVRSLHVTAFVALGSNLGNREAQLRWAVRSLAANPDLAIQAVSSIYETAAVGPAGQGDYLNAVLQLATDISPRALLEELLRIERAAGRVREREPARWGPRCLDLDLLLYGDLCLREPGLEVPHPRMHERAFVLEPLCELAPDRLHPRLGETFARLARSCRAHEAVRPFPGTGIREAAGLGA